MRVLIPIAGGGESVEIQVGAAIHGGVGELDYAGEPNHAFLIELIADEQLGVVAEIAQEPGELPERSFRAPEAPGKGSAGQSLGLNYGEANCVKGFCLSHRY